MNKSLLVTALLAVAPYTSLADVMPKEAYKAMLNLFAYDANGKLLRSGTAFYIDAQGHAATYYSLLRDAARAEVIDPKGKKHQVVRILGGDATTDLVKFSTSQTKPTDFFRLTDTAGTTGSDWQLVSYTSDKKKTLQAVKVNGDEAFNQYRYYQVIAANDASLMACPLIDEAGNLMAVVQRNVNASATTACAIDARFLNELTIRPTSAFSNDLRAIHIPKALPAKSSEAMAYLFMIPKTDTLSLQTAHNDFVEAYPTLPDGYMNRASFRASLKDYAGADADFQTAFAKAEADTTGTKLDAVHHSLSQLIYQTVVAKGDTLPVYPTWTLARAEAEATQAYTIHPFTLYLMQQGNCRYAQGNYTGAYESFNSACEDRKFASYETFFAAARALERTGTDSTRVIALLDSCIAHLPQPANARHAHFYFERAQRLIQAKRFREAVFDYNEYEKLVGPRNLNERFYYLRHLAEVEARMYQQALDDLHSAIAQSATPLPYRLDEAYLLLRIGELDTAARAARALLKELPENPDCYKIIGIVLGEQGKKAEAVQSLNKAQQLGDDTVAPLIEKYQ